MPRKRMTQSGDPAQKIGSVPGQRYGEGQAQQAMQQAMPAPNRVGAVPPQGADTNPLEPTAASPGPDPAAIQAFLAQNNPDLLAGTQLPDQPVTAGLSTGPGAGPESLQLLQSTTPLRRYLENLSMQSGDPTFRRLIERAGL